MKGVMLLLSLLVVLGVLYGMALVGVLPAQKWADKSPALARPLIALHLAKRPRKSSRVAKKDSTPRPPITGEQEQIAAARAQLDKDRAAFEAQKQAAAAAPGTGGATTPPLSEAGRLPASPASGAGGPAPDTAAKLVAIYDTMSPDDVARIFGKLPDSQVVSILMQLDEKKDGRILAALPADRAARINLLMAHGPTRTASAAPPPHPLTVIP